MAAVTDTVDDLVARLTEQLGMATLSPAQKQAVQRRLNLLAPALPERWAGLAGSDLINAARYLARAALIAPGDFRFHVNISNRRLQSGEVGEAVVSLKRAGLLEPAIPRIYSNLAALSGGRDRTRSLVAWSWACGGF